MFNGCSCVGSASFNDSLVCCALKQSTENEDPETCSCFCELGSKKMCPNLRMVGGGGAVGLGLWRICKLTVSESMKVLLSELQFAFLFARTARKAHTAQLLQSRWLAVCVCVCVCVCVLTFAVSDTFKIQGTSGDSDHDID